MLEEDKIDVGEADEQTTEIDLDAPAPEQSLEEEIQVEEVSEDSSQPADAPAEPPRDALQPAPGRRRIRGVPLRKIQ